MSIFLEKSNWLFIIVFYCTLTHLVFILNAFPNVTEQNIVITNDSQETYETVLDKEVMH